MFKFSGNGGPEGHYYSVELEFLKEVIPQVISNEYFHAFPAIVACQCVKS